MIGSSLARGRRSWEVGALLGIVAIAAWLRLRDLNLAEFKADEATALDLARRLLDGELLTHGLTSSAGADNPPLFVYLTAIPLIALDDPLAAIAFVAATAIAAVLLTYVVLRPRFGAFVALSASALFATAPWAVLYGRKLWGQSVLPLVAVLLLWSLFAVLERTRSSAVGFVPILLCLAFQLNFSALALVLPASVVLLYRARAVNWRLLIAGVGSAALLLAPWLYDQASSDFGDVTALLGRGDRIEASSADPNVIDAIGHTVRLVGMGDWEYVAADSLPLFVAEAGATWDLARGGSLLAVALLALGALMCAIGTARTAHTSRGWPWIALTPAGAARGLLLVWLAGVCLIYATPAADRLYPHYLIVSFPVSFAVQAVGLADLASLLRGALRRPALIGAVATVTLVAVAHLGFTISFHHFLDTTGGTAGDYGVVYRDKADLAAAVRERKLRVVDEPVVDFLVTGRLTRPGRDPAYVTVSDRFHNEAPPCAGRRRSFGALDACFPRP